MTVKRGELEKKLAAARRLLDNPDYQEVIGDVGMKLGMNVFMNPQSTEEERAYAHNVIKALNMIDRHILSLENAISVQLKIDEKNRVGQTEDA